MPGDEEDYAKPRVRPVCQHCGEPIEPSGALRYSHVATGVRWCDRSAWVESGWHLVKQGDRVRITYPDGSVLIGELTDDMRMSGKPDPVVAWFRSQATGDGMVSVIGTTVEVLRSDSEPQLPSSSNS